ncbi:MAG: dolichyl-diphosphooligosaccharide--protein glycosyltransferase subunit STT3 [Helicobacter sp.]|nr:dolichyl-diphosphooligosaccharide--protein glycosyltransferase subunit STT3 [Helicobacter sp.]
MANLCIKPLSQHPKPLLRAQHLCLSVLVFVALFCVRLHWLFFALDNADFLLDCIPMLNNNDGYYYAEGARDILAGFHQDGDLSPVHSPLSILSAALAFVLPLPLDWLLLFLPAVFGSLVAFPLYFFFVAFVPSRFDERLKTFCACFAAFFGGIVVSYYNRTMIGYYDTDMLIIVLPLCAIFCLLRFTQTQSRIMLCAFFVFAILAQQWHTGLSNLFLAIFALCVVWALVGRFCAIVRAPFALLPIIAAFSVLLVPFWWLQILLAGAIVRVQNPKAHCVFIALSLLLSALFGGFSALLYPFQAYFLQQLPQDSSLVFHDVVGTIREVSSVSLTEAMQRISSTVPLFVVSLLGYIALCVQRPHFLLGLPFVLLGFAGAKIGLRFNLFATPFLALGLGFVLLFCLSLLPKWRLFVALPLATLLCMPSFAHIMHYNVPSVFHKDEAQLLQALKTLAKPTDYLITWWDYGYGARYYGDVKTLIDGGKHSGAVNYPVSLMLATPNMKASATLAALTTYTTEKYRNFSEDNAIVEQLLRDSPASSPRNFLLRLENGMLDVPPMQHDIFYYLPLQMFEIFDVIASFSNIDFAGGILREDSMLHVAHVYRVADDVLFADNNLALNLQTGELHNGESRVPLRAFVRMREVSVDSDSASAFVRTIPHAERVDFSTPSRLFAVWLESQNKLIVCDEFSFYSTTLQLFVFGENETFALVASNPLGRIFKVRKRID